MCQDRVSATPHDALTITSHHISEPKMDFTADLY